MDGNKLRLMSTSDIDFLYACYTLTLTSEFETIINIYEMKNLVLGFTYRDRLTNLEVRFQISRSYIKLLTIVK